MGKHIIGDCPLAFIPSTLKCPIAALWTVLHWSLRLVEPVIQALVKFFREQILLSYFIKTVQYCDITHKRKLVGGLLLILYLFSDDPTKL